jgi:hypothetical protein
MISLNAVSHSVNGVNDSADGLNDSASIQKAFSGMGRESSQLSVFEEKRDVDATQS